jgi:hypothetical protein
MLSRPLSIVVPHPPRQHLEIAKEVGDRVGEGRAYGGLGNAHDSLGEVLLLLLLLLPNPPPPRRKMSAFPQDQPCTADASGRLIWLCGLYGTYGSVPGGLCG